MPTLFIVPVVTNKSLPKWREKLNVNISNEMWSLYCSIPFRCSNDLKIRWFQYRVIHRLIPTNVYRYNISTAESNQCSLCHDALDTIEHSFVHCLYVLPLWEFLHYHLENADIELNTHDTVLLILGCNRDQMFNLIIILVKFYIFKSNAAKATPSVHGLRVF